MSPRKAAPIKDVEVLSDKKKIKLLMDPLRIAIISVLGREPMTVKQIAVELNRKPGTILHHLDRLKKAKLVVQVRTEKTRTGIVQRYYRATAREYQIGVAKVVSRKPTLEETKETLEDRWRGVIIGLAEYGIVIPESKMEHALDLLRAMTECEDNINRRVYRAERSSMAPHIQAEVTRIMRRLALDQDNECSRIQASKMSPNLDVRRN
ncbi:MAG: helix-turn-helix domain-containing protein [Candidatus Thorarchaeota archaeon]